MARMTENRVMQSGVVPFRLTTDGVEILLITSRKTGAWILPKGHLEPFMSAWDSAAKEAMEEAGAVGDIIVTPVGSAAYRKRGLLHQVTYYPMAVEQLMATWPEFGSRRRKWHRLDKAPSRVADPALRRLLATLPEIFQLQGITETVTAATA